MEKLRWGEARYHGKKVRCMDTWLDRLLNLSLLEQRIMGWRGRGINFDVVGVDRAKRENMKKNAIERENGKEQDTYYGGWKSYFKFEDEGLKKVSELAMAKKGTEGRVV
ncbi:hypothetical protein K435DRAFT_488046 [Dendrothele bispora CBS 962.96]|uniref:Uncharacterized protein n=1 Tax=Dendrothele bispora (strain CBS 962.96) TaxID=1314807 RepID=A0A4S8KZD6_DENBC|nr:hypothetical protein K435DRAFT_488046 [Dendrothele bispora CBS 962.96]